MAKKIISAIYVISLLVAVICAPISAIMVVCKLCDATPLSWIACCVPFIVAIAVLPSLIITKILLDMDIPTRGKKEEK